MSQLTVTHPTHPMLYARAQPRIEWYVGGVRQNLQTGLSSHQPFAGRPNGASAGRRMDRRLQRNSSALSAQNALPKGVHQSSGPIASVSGEMGGTPPRQQFT